MNSFSGYASGPLNTIVVTTGSSGSKLAVSGTFPGTCVNVFDHGTLTLSSIFYTGSAALENPFLAGSDGSFTFLGAAASYDLVFTGPGTVATANSPQTVSVSASTPLAATMGGTGLSVSTNPNRQFEVAGAFGGSVDSIGVGVDSTLTVPTTGDGSLMKLAGTVTAAATGTNGILCGIMSALNFASLGAAITGVYGFFQRTFVAPASAGHAYGIGIDAPTGATRNYALLVSGDVDLKGACQLIFEQTLGGDDVFIAGAPSNGGYIPGSLTGDLIFRSGTHRFLFSIDGGNHANFFIGAGVSVGNATDPGLGVISAAAGVGHNAVTFANRPAGVEGTIMAVTDSTTNVIGNTVTGGGANHVLAYYNGTNWVVLGK